MTTACGGSSGGEQGADEGVTLRFNWWGSDGRHAMTQEVIDLFESEHPNIDVQPEFSAFSDYFNKLSTGAASQDLPDVMQMTDPYMYSYIDNGQLVDLKEYEDVLPTGDFTEASLAGIQVDDGLYGVPAGASGFGMAINPRLFEQAGVALPDDATWTWDEYKDIAVQISEAIPEVTGTSLFMDEQTMALWLRQHGEDYWKNDGTEIGFSAETAADWFEFIRDVRDSGATRSAEAEIEAAGLALEQTPLALGQTAMSLLPVNQLGNLEKSAGQEFLLVQLPGEGEFEQAGQWTKAGVFYSIASNSEHPEEAAMLVDFLSNSTEAAEITKFDRGVPTNTAVLEALEPTLTPVEQRVADFTTTINDRGAPPYALPHPDAGPVLIAAVIRLSQEVAFDRLTPQEAADQLITEVESAM